MDLITSVFITGICLSAIMASAWRFQHVTGNSGWIDVFWTFGTGAAACTLALLPFEGSGWPNARQMLVAAFAGSWSLRLGFHILLRTRMVDDDPRYRDLIIQWGEHAKSKLFWQLQAQAAVGLLLASSVMLAAQNLAENFRFQDVIAVGIFLIGCFGEATADSQLRRFKQSELNRGKICDAGLWGFSRHPNYFFEWLCWLAYPLLAIDVHSGNLLGYVSLLAPLCMYWLLVYVSGIPPLEAHMMRTREVLFISYRQRTNAFFPWPSRKT
jgi:steroid 5-alpha reductase family enzyme